MSVVIIGERKTGKTSMVRALAEQGKNVKIVNDSGNLVRELYNPATKEIAGTEKMIDRFLEISIEMPATGTQLIEVLWVDTPGEMWSNRQDNSVQYQRDWRVLESKISDCKAVILLLPPHQKLLIPILLNSAASHLKPTVDIPSCEDWVKRLNKWLIFLNESCKKVKHILIGIHKADLFCDVQAEGTHWGFRTDRAIAAPWYEYDQYVQQTYFASAYPEIRQFKATEVGSRTHFFITTTENQALLELPWLFLGPYLAFSQ